MTSKAPLLPAPRALALLVGLLAPAGAIAAETPYPFEGTWIRAERTCAPTTVRARVYTAREVVSPRGRCAIRRVVAGSGSFELQEECRRNDRTATVTEIIRMTSPDSLVLRRQLARLKIPRQLRYTRCSVAAGQVQAPAPRASKVPAPGDPKARDRETDAE